MEIIPLWDSLTLLSQCVIVSALTHAGDNVLSQNWFPGPFTGLRCAVEQIEQSAYCHPHSQLGADAARRAMGTQHLRPRGKGSIATQLLAGCQLSFLSPRTPHPLSYHAHAYLQLLIHQKHSRSWLGHTSSLHTYSVNTQGIPPIFFFFSACVRYSVFMWHRAESIWALLLLQ